MSFLAKSKARSFEKQENKTVKTFPADAVQNMHSHMTAWEKNGLVIFIITFFQSKQSIK